MSLARVIVPEEAARDTIERVGELGVMQFQDLNSDTPPFKRAYATQIRRADELLRRLRYFRDEARRAAIAVARSRRRNATGRGSGTTTTTTDELDHVTEELERDLAQALKNYERLTRTHSELMELQLVLEKAGGIFEESRADGGGRGTVVAVGVSETGGGRRKKKKKTSVPARPAAGNWRRRQERLRRRRLPAAPTSCVGQRSAPRLHDRDCFKK